MDGVREMLCERETMILNFALRQAADVCVARTFSLLRWATLTQRPGLGRAVRVRILDDQKLQLVNMDMPLSFPLTLSPNFQVSTCRYLKHKLIRKIRM